MAPRAFRSELALFRAPMAVRAFAAGKEEAKDKMEGSQLLRLKSAGVMVGTGAAVVVSWWSVKKVMQTIGAVYAKPHLVAYAAYWCGVGTMSLGAALVFALYRLTHIRPENVFHQTLAIVKQNAQVQAGLGSSIQASSLKTYEITGGRMAMTDGRPHWAPHECQITYLIHGKKNVGLVTARCAKLMTLRPGRLTFKLLAVDVLDRDKIRRDEESVMIHGTKEDLDIHDSIYKLLNMKVDLMTAREEQKKPAA